MCKQLPNSDKYLQRLEMFAKCLGIKIEYKPEDGDGSFTYRTKKIRIDTDLSPIEEVAVLLHELGHAVDDMLIDDKIYKSIDKAYSLVYKKRVSKKRQALVLSCEKRAWQYGRSIAKQLKIPLGKWYTSTETNCIKGYRE